MTEVTEKENHKDWQIPDVLKCIHCHGSAPATKEISPTWLGTHRHAPLDDFTLENMAGDIFSTGPEGWLAALHDGGRDKGINEAATASPRRPLTTASVSTGTRAQVTITSQ